MSYAEKNQRQQNMGTDSCRSAGIAASDIFVLSNFYRSHNRRAFEWCSRHSTTCRFNDSDRARHFRVTLTLPTTIQLLNVPDYESRGWILIHITEKKVA